MVLTIISIWICAIAIGIVGASAALANRWVGVLGSNVVAGIFSVALFVGLKGEFAISLIQAGDIYIWIAMLGLIIMWSILAVGSSFAIWKQRNQIAAL